MRENKYRTKDEPINETIEKTETSKLTEDGRIIYTWRDPYGEGFSTCRPKQVTFHPGVTVLVGCNGSGQTTMLNNIAEELKQVGVPYHKYDNLTQGGREHLSDDLFNGNYGVAAARWSASEGENIAIGVGELFARFKEFIETGRIKNRDTNIHDIFKEYKVPETKERWLLFDAIDSGFSIDNIIDVKFVFNEMVKDAKEMGYDLYIVVSANEYELVSENPCMDVTNGRYMTFKTYGEFRNFILNSKKKKERRDHPDTRKVN